MQAIDAITAVYKDCSTFACARCSKWSVVNEVIVMMFVTSSRDVCKDALRKSNLKVIVFIVI